MSIPSSAKAGKHTIRIKYSDPRHGTKDTKELHFFVKNPGGWDKDADAEALKARFPGATVAMLEEGMPSKALGVESYAGCADAKINSTHRVADRNTDGVNWGGTAELVVGHYGLVHRTLIRWDLARIPKNAKVEAAWLKLYLFRSPSRHQGKGWPQGKYAYRVLRPWGAGVGNGSLYDKKKGKIRKGESSWLAARHPEKWGRSGCDQPGVDRAEKPLSVSQCDSQPKDAKGRPQQVKKVWVKWDVTAAAKDWVAHPEKNFGLLLAVKDGKLKSWNERIGQTANYFRSANFRDPVFRPRLVVVFRK